MKYPHLTAFLFNNMKIHLVPFNQKLSDDDPSSLAMWKHLAELSGTERFFTDIPESADRILFVDLHVAHHLDVRKTITQHPLFKDNRNKILVWNEKDRPVFDVRGLYVNVPVGLTLDQTVVPIPYLFVPADSLFFGTNFSYQRRTVTCTYRGTNTHKCRRVLATVNHPNYSLVDSTQSNSITKSEYLAELDQSVHALCPRGHGLSSFRMYEAMARGCLPVIIADGWVPPKGIAWDQFCTFVKESDAKHFPNSLDYSERELTQRQGSLFLQFNAHLSADVRMMYFLKQISDIPFGDCLSVSYRAKSHNLNLKLRQKITSLAGLIERR